MATSNPILPTAWVQLVPAGDDFTLGIGDDQPLGAIALAVTPDDSPPTIVGQVLRTPTGALNRVLSGPGYLWAKSLIGGPAFGVRRPRLGVGIRQMSQADFDYDLFGFAVSVVGMAVCVIGASLWICWV